MKKELKKYHIPTKDPNIDKYLNPVSNYKKWSSLNWFGVWFFTILIYITFLPYVIILLLLLFILVLFTYGREEK